MSVSPGYLEFVLEQLGRALPVTFRRMFGAVGLYSRGHFFAIVDDDRLYFKADDGNRADYEGAGMGPFRPYGDERSMDYWEVPADALEEPELLRDWAEKAVAAATRGGKPRVKGKKAAPARKPAAKKKSTSAKKAPVKKKSAGRKRAR